MPKVKFEKVDIINVAFEIAKEKGFNGITARDVAKKMGSSVAPIYVNFQTMDELVEEVVKKVFTLSDLLVARQKGDSLFEKIGRASLEFAREYPVLFRELVLKPNPYMTNYETVEKSMLKALENDDQLSGLTLEKRKRVFFKMRIFQTGLTALVSNGHIPKWISENELDEILFEAGEDFLVAQKMRGE